MKDECLSILSSIGEEQTPKRQILEGEDIFYDSFDASYDSFPEDARISASLELINEEISLSKQQLYSQIETKRRYLWVIKDNKIFIALEDTPNDKAARKCICHSNLTGGKTAIAGGELWFMNEPVETIKLNFKSGRYPLSDPGTQAQLIIDLFKCVGYKEVELIIED